MSCYCKELGLFHTEKENLSLSKIYMNCAIENALSTSAYGNYSARGIEEGLSLMNAQGEIAEKIRSNYLPVQKAMEQTLIGIDEAIAKVESSIHYYGGLDEAYHKEMNDRYR